MQKLSFKIFFVLVFCTVVYASPMVSVEAYDEQQNNPSYLTLRIRITNNTQDSLHNIRMKYELPYDSTRYLQVHGYYLGESFQKAVLSFDTSGNRITMNIDVDAVGPGVYPNQGGLSIGMNYVDAKDFKKHSSVCYPDANVFAKTEKIPVFVSGRLALGKTDATPMGLIDGAEVFLFSNQKVPFAWQPIPGAKQYRLSIYNTADSTLAYGTITESPSSMVSLDKGEYLWDVQASSYGFSYLEQKIESEGGKFKRVSIDTINVDDEMVHPIADLHVSPLAARKDSPMLDVKWGELLDSMEWDRPHDTSAYIDSVDHQLKFRDLKHQNWDNSEGWRCWAVATIMMNHYYGGNATQDELVFHVKTLTKKDSVLDAFVHGEQGKGRFNTEWAFGINQNEQGKNLSASQLVESISSGNPVAICELGHCMVIDACSYYEHEGVRDTLCRFLNVDNNGTSVWMNWANHSDYLDGGYYFLRNGQVPAPRMADSLVIDPVTKTWRDSDKDGIIDFDEVYRFKTDPYKKDSDNDGIEDKIEIWSYTRLEPYGSAQGVLEEKYADIDCDGKRAELDSDSDDDGVNDGQEDLNHNGRMENGERNPYYNEGLNQEILALDYFGMYALNQLQVNDGAKCYVGTDTIMAKYCNVAAAGGMVDNYTVNIGSRAVVGNVFSRGDFFLRSESSIDTLYTIEPVDDTLKHKPSNSIIAIHVQNPFYRKDKELYDDFLWKSKWPVALSASPFEKTSSRSVIVKRGDTLTLDKDRSYKLIRVESMGVLVIPPGEYWIEELQMHTGAGLYFTEPGKSSVLHINGNFYWHPTLMNDDYSTVAAGFKVVHHGSRSIFVEGRFWGTIIAPESEVVLGQSVKVFYGSVLARNITLHQHSKFYHIPYKPE